MIKNQELAEQILLVMNTMLNFIEEMQELFARKEMKTFEEKGIGLFQMVKSLEAIAEPLREEEEGINLPQAIASVKFSLARIIKNAHTDTEFVEKKLEFELLPLVEEMRSSFYFWGLIYPEQERLQNYYLQDINILGGNRYTREAMCQGEYKYDLSILVLAYNKRAYTECCLQALYKNLPKGITYEIILVNHGSNDDTKELFEAYHPDKQLDVAVNGGGAGAVFRITEGKYVLLISNDVLVTQNAIQNIYNCMDSDETIAWAVPTTPNVSNYQTIEAQYSTLEEMEEFAKKNNVSDEYRWEQRTRLCNPIDMVRADFLEKTKTQYILHAPNRMSFPDDKRSLVCRRNGYKMYLVKDAYCFHFGSVTLKEDATINSVLQYKKGRELFMQAYGIDPWTPSCCYAWNLMRALECEEKGEVKILGIDCGLGSNPLKIKDKIKESAHNKKSYITNYLLSDEFLEDIRGVSDEVYVIESVQELAAREEKYHYIINECRLDLENEWKKQYEICKKLLKNTGTLIMLIKKEIGETVVKMCKREHNMVQIVANGERELWSSEYVWLILKE